MDGTHLSLQSGLPKTPPVPRPRSFTTLTEVSKIATVLLEDIL